MGCDVIAWNARIYNIYESSHEYGTAKNAIAMVSS